MTHFWLFLLACSGGEAPKATPNAAWMGSVRPWYCGAEAIPPRSPTDAASSRDIAVKLTPTEDALLGLYAVREGERKYIGTLTRFVATGDRAATLHSENDQHQKGEAKLTFSQDFSTLNLEWQVGFQTGVTHTTLTAADDPAACAAGRLLE